MNFKLSNLYCYLIYLKIEANFTLNNFNAKIVLIF